MGKQKKDSHINDIAIIGIGCRYPGQADDPESFWEIVSKGIDTVSKVPDERIRKGQYTESPFCNSNNIDLLKGGFIENVDQFDARFFEISPREAEKMDPQQRILLEVAYEALTDAGLPIENLKGTNTGVYIGMITTDYRSLLFSNSRDIDIYAVTGGSARCIVAGRISYSFDLRGPSIEVDTACSSSLVSLNLACQSLLAGETNLALAGGVNLILSGEETIGYANAEMIAEDGRCKFGDAKADGFVRSEGVGIVVLKKLSQAIQDKDSIYCVIKGIGVTNDGSSSGFMMTPSGKGQRAAIITACEQTGVSAGNLDFIECHGVGTTIGDPIEIKAVGETVSVSRYKKKPCYLGSSKTNFGHSEAAAGIAGLIKTALALNKKEIPQNINFQTPNNEVPWDSMDVELPLKTIPWPKNKRKALAGVSSFGISGVNVHAVLEEFNRPNKAQKKSTRKLIATLSAKNENALNQYAENLIVFLENKQQKAEFSDICYSLNLRSSFHEVRLSVVAGSKKELASTLKAFLSGDERPGMTLNHVVETGEDKIAFVFPGQGSQWIAMGKELYRNNPVFRNIIDKCENAMKDYVNWELVNVLTSDKDETWMERVDVIQPAIFAMQVGLAALWESYGIKPQAVVGHSLGEVAAAYVAGALSLQDAVKVICLRSQLVRKLSGKGGMAFVELSLKDARNAIAGYEDRVAIGVSNSPNATVLSGDEGLLKKIISELEEKDIYCKFVNVDYASHSPQVDSLKDELVEKLEGIQPMEAEIPIYSTAKSRVTFGAEFDEVYWADNLRNPVMFSSSITRMGADDYHYFIEISPHPVLIPSIKQSLADLERNVTVLPSLRRDFDAYTVFLGSMGALFTKGYTIDFSHHYEKSNRFIRLPRYPWQRESFWFKPKFQKLDKLITYQQKSEFDKNGHAILGAPLETARQTDDYTWDFIVDLNIHSFLKDHRVQDAIVFPGTAYLDLVISAAKQVFGSDRIQLSEVVYREAVFLSEDQPTRFQLFMELSDEAVYQWQLLSKKIDKSSASEWTLNANGNIQFDNTESSIPGEYDLEEIESRCDLSIEGKDFYHDFSSKGNQWLGAFQGITHIQYSKNEALGEIILTDETITNLGQFTFHPAVLDVCGQIMAIDILSHNLSSDDNTFVLQSIKRFDYYSTPQKKMWCYLEPGTTRSGNTLTGSIAILGEDSQLIGKFWDISFRFIGEADEINLDIPDEQWMYKMDWINKDIQNICHVPAPASTWLFFVESFAIWENIQPHIEKTDKYFVFIYPGKKFKRLNDYNFEINPSESGDYEQLLEVLRETGKANSLGLIHAWNLLAQNQTDINNRAFENASQIGVLSILKLIQAISNLPVVPKSWLRIITSNAQSISDDHTTLFPLQFPVWGLGRTLAEEHPELNCCLIDLDKNPDFEDWKLLADILFYNQQENQLLIRKGMSYAARLKQFLRGKTIRKANDKIKSVEIADGAGWRLSIDSPGLVDRLELIQTGRKSLGPGQVEIEICSSGLNFRDVLLTMGMYPGQTAADLKLGSECSGVILRVSDDVDRLKPGDRVMSMANSCLASHLITSQDLVIQIPDNISFTDAATIPVGFITTYYALHTLAALQPKESVLIHSATGGTGLAAIQVAQWKGAEIFATAGTEEKREFLKRQGIEHVFNSRSLEFDREIKQRTNGEGVDVILNSLSGEAVQRNMTLLKPRGRYLEISKKDILANKKIGLAILKNNTSYFGIDVVQLISQKPAFMGSILKEIVQKLKAGVFKPLPVNEYSVEQIHDAFKYLQRTKHIGKIVINNDRKQLKAKPRKATDLDSSEAYLITGGLGGIGLETADWLVEKGARNILLIGRSDFCPRNLWDQAEKGSRLEYQIEKIRRMEDKGANIHIASLDVSQRKEMTVFLDRFSIEQKTVFRGVIHSAGILKYAPALKTTDDTYRSVYSSKIPGSWNLYQYFKDKNLEFLVLFSSGSSLIGSPMLSAYAASNAFLDGLGIIGRSEGMPISVVNWGYWDEVGMTANKNMVPKGAKSFKPKDGLNILETILNSQISWVTVMPTQWSEWRKHYPNAAKNPLLSEILGTGDITDSATEIQSERFMENTGDYHLKPDHLYSEEWIKTKIFKYVADVLLISKDSFDTRTSIKSLGLDSLMAVELRSRIIDSIGVSVPVIKLLKGGTVEEVCRFIMDKLQVDDLDKSTNISVEKTDSMVEIII